MRKRNIFRLNARHTNRASRKGFISGRVRAFRLGQAVRFFSK